MPCSWTTDRSTAPRMPSRHSACRSGSSTATAAGSGHGRSPRPSASPRRTTPMRCCGSTTTWSSTPAPSCCSWPVTSPTLTRSWSARCARSAAAAPSTADGSSRADASSGPASSLPTAPTARSTCSTATWCWCPARRGAGSEPVDGSWAHQFADLDYALRAIDADVTAMQLPLPVGACQPVLAPWDDPRRTRWQRVCTVGSHRAWPGWSTARFWWRHRQHVSTAGILAPYRRSWSPPPLTDEHLAAVEAAELESPGGPGPTQDGRGA